MVLQQMTEKQWTPWKGVPILPSDLQHLWCLLERNRGHPQLARAADSMLCSGNYS